MLCREQAAQLRDRQEEIRATGAEIIAVGIGSPGHAAGFVEDFAIPFPVFVDSELRVYRALGARRGLGTALRLGTFRAALGAFRRGFRQSAATGDAMQQGGVLVVLPDGSVPYHHLSTFAGDHPDPDALLAALRRLRRS